MREALAARAHRRASRPPRATTPPGASASATRSASSRTSSSPGATPAPTLEAVLAALATDAELVTCIAGEGAPLDADAIAALAPDGVELELEDGGQPSYWWLLAAE